MNWQERLWEQKWLLPILPNYMKPLDEPALLNQHTREFVYEAEEFISDLAALSELPRMNKTFKRSVHGLSYKIKIKPKKIHLELADTNKSSSAIKKKVFITIFRKHVRMENGFGKVIDSSIYYQLSGNTYVRNIRRHSYFLPLFHHLHRLDLSLSGESLQSFDELNKKHENQNEIESVQTPGTDNEQVDSLKQSIYHTQRAFSKYDPALQSELDKLAGEFNRCLEEFHLLDIEEKHHIKRMAQHDLPNLIQTYYSLTETQRQEKQRELINALQNMNSFLKEQANDLQSTRVDRMNHLLRLTSIRYENNQYSDHQE
ncbi:hypothetical protein [Salisediminibacterium beveridgei]|uniref:Uncharacterized protein n=1 Tax=Salisediminibacterium beveridgei TaxID=632773 RepID=A0A1D7QV70_9BACI|nr:hypothetical protein [Salisediminibacterium beveridgei]AOM82858.1 hypothetical protein BBEV_1495 [Salisediminibacterium beveridgei]